MINRISPSQRRRPLAGAITAGLLFLAAAPAAAQHRARLSADLEDHVSAGSQSIDVIVDGDQAKVDAVAARYNLVVKRRLASGAVLHVNAGQLVALQQEEMLDHLSGDVRIQSSVLEVTAESIGADQVWAGADGRPGLSGQGVSVAVIDSGIDTRHNALKNRVLVTRDFTGGDGVDRYGHGTHVAAIIAGQAGRTADTRGYRGIAWGAYLLNLRVLGDDGSGMASNVIEAIDWTIAHRREYNVRVINLSLGAPVMQPYRDDPLCEAVERAVKAGITVVVAAGNYGRTADGKPVYGSIASPANSPYSIAVGAIDTHETPQRPDDTLAPFSSKGPTRYDLILKPDVAAPGTHVVSAESAGSYLSRTYATRHVAGSGDDAYMQLSGTSMAAGVVSGAVALLLDARSTLTPRETRAALQLTSTFLPSAGLLGAGAGIVNAVAAVELVETNVIPTTTIAGEDAVASGFFTESSTSRLVTSFTSNRWKSGRTRALSGKKILWRAADSIIWGSSADSIIWGSSAASIIWGSSAASIIWGSSAASIIWGSSADSIIWGSSAASIIWGSSADSIIWGSSAGSIIWGSADPQ